MFKRVVLILVSLTLGIIRISGVTHVFFQAIAHCFVGGLIGAHSALRGYPSTSGERRFYLTLAITLSILETLCFVYFKTIQSH